MLVRTAVWLFPFVVLGGSAHASILFENFSDVSGLSFVNSASQFGVAARVSPAAQFASGAFWYADAQRVSDGFVTEFTFRFTQTAGPDRSGQSGGDGMAFVIQAVGDQAIGALAGELGYALIPKSLAVELDTFHNDWDLSSNDVGIHSRGTLPNSNRTAGQLGLATVPGDFADGAVHRVKIEYATGYMSVFMDDLMSPLLRLGIPDLAHFIGADDGLAWVGFTASTGRAVENHDVLSWRFDPAGAVPEPTSFAIWGALATVGLIATRRRKRVVG